MRELKAQLIRSGHCLLMKEELAKAYTAYQQALYHLPNPKVRISLCRCQNADYAGAQTMVRHRHPLRPVWIV